MEFDPVLPADRDSFWRAQNTANVRAKCAICDQPIYVKDGAKPVTAPDALSVVEPFMELPNDGLVHERCFDARQAALTPQQRLVRLEKQVARLMQIIRSR